MTKKELEKTFKIAFFSSMIYFVILFIYIIIMGRVINAPRIPEASIYLSLFVAFVFFITGIITIIYWIKEKIYKNIAYGFGTIFFSLLTLLLSMIISIANAWG